VNTTINASTSTFGVTLNGSSGNDSLSGGSAADTVSGGSGNDMITGGAGADSLTGGDGNDVFRFISGDELGEDVLVQGDGGANSIEITAADLTIVDADFTDVRNIQTLALTGASTVVLDVAAFAAGITNVTTGADATSITTNATVAAVSINAAALADGTALTLADLNTAAFTVTGLSGDIVTDAVAGTLTVTTAAVANSSIETAAGATTISGLATAVSVDAADLVDSINLTLNDATNYTVTNLEGNVVAGGSTGTLNIALDDVNDNVASIGAGTGNVTVTGGAATDIVTVTGLGTVGQVFTATAALSSFNVTGGAGAQSITGGSGNDTITGGAGNDTITGGAGNDQMTGGSDADTFDITTTAADTDRISDWGLGADVLAGSAFAGQRLIVTIVNTSTTAFNASTAFDTNGVVSVTGGSGNDTITGGVGADTITGGNGNDIITGGAGADSLIGGDGNDLFLFNTGDIVTGEVINGGEGVNTLRVVTSTNLSEVTSIEKVDYFQVTDSTTVTALGSQLHMAPINVNGFGGGGVSTAHIDVVGVDVVDLSNITFTASGTGTAFISGTDIIDIDGDEANNTITGTTLADNIAGNDGDDTLLGGAGNDTIEGGIGNDMITGGAGADVISVAFVSGSDTLVYAAMTDTLNSTTAFVNGLTVTDADIITGFYLGDMVDLSALAIDIESGPLGSGFASNLSVDALNLIKGTWSGTTFTASIEGVDYLLQIVESSGTATNAGVVFDNVGSNMVALWNSVTETITLYDTYYPT
jgi:Ca2+-binding RTX toxin-like protein